MKKNQPTISEIKFVTISVTNLERSIAFYRDILGYVESGIVPISGKDFEGAWRMPRGLKGQSVVMGVKGINSGMLRLVQFDRPGERIWGNYSPMEIIGYYAINFAVKDLNALWPRLLKAGAVPKSNPTLWNIHDDVSVWDSLSYDPDGILLDIYNRVTKEPSDAVPAATEVQTMAINVSNAQRSKSFYQGMGYSKLFYENMLENIEHFLGIPKGAKIYNVNMMNPRTRGGRIELAEAVGFTCDKVLRDRSVPPNIGMLSLSFETDDIEATCQLIKGLGGQEISGPVRVVLPKVGAVRLATFFGPDGEALEFYQPV